MPVMQLIIIPLAADFEVKNINIAIVNNDHSTLSDQLISKITASGYFRLTEYGNSYKEAYNKFERDKADIVLEIPPNFEKDLLRENKQKLYLATNAINGLKALLGSNYLARIIGNFNAELRSQLTVGQPVPPAPTIEIAAINWYNVHLNYRFFMVPGILVLLVTIVGAYLSSLNIVKEKEVGTIEQINVTPIRKVYFILGKLLPFWIIGNVVFTIGLFLVARILYGIVPEGNIFALYGFLWIYLVAVLGIGLLVSTYSANQQQAMSLMFFFMMIFVLMGGLFTPIDSMPDWAKMISRFNPVTYFIEVMRMIVMKGSSWDAIKQHIYIMFGFAVFFNTWAIWNYRKTS